MTNSQSNTPSPNGVTSPKGSSRLVFGLGSCYALGTFTDNFFKQCAVLLAASMAVQQMQGLATALYSLPFILFSAWAGWIADRFVKKHIVLAAKTTELAALIIGAISLYTASWEGILLVVFLMGLQSTMFSPALNGSIPESFPPELVPRINSFIKLASTIAVLGGIAVAGIFLDLRPSGSLPDISVQSPEEYGRIMAGLFLILIGILGVLAALLITSRPAAMQKGSGSPFPKNGPIDSVRHFFEYRKDKELFFVLLCEGLFYGIAAIAVISIANIAKQLGYSQTIAGLLSAVIMIGIALGAIYAGKFSADGWKRLLYPAALGMGIFMALVPVAESFQAANNSLLSLRFAWLLISLLFAGICGGIYLIPLSSFLQVRPKANEKGKVLGVSNFFSFVAIAACGIVFIPVSLLPAEWSFMSYGLGMILFSLFFIRKSVTSFPDVTLQQSSSCLTGLFLKMLLAARYSVSENGLDSIAESEHDATGIKRPILFLPNHPALIDPLIVFSRIAGSKPRILADANQMGTPLKRLVARSLNMVTIPDTGKGGLSAGEGVKKGLKALVTAMQQGDNVLLYPAGRLYRSQKEELGGNSGVRMLLDAVPNLRIVLVRTTGLWGSSFSYASGKKPIFSRTLLAKIPLVLANLLFFMPKRPVTIEFVEPQDFPRTGTKQYINAYMEHFYNRAEKPAVTYPNFFFEGRQPYPLQDQQKSTSPTAYDESALDKALTPEQRKRVFSILREQIGSPDDIPGYSLGTRPDDIPLEAADKTNSSAAARHSSNSTNQSARATFNLTDRLGADLGLDSLNLIDTATALEKAFGHPVESIEQLITVNDCLLAAAGMLQEAETTCTAPPEWFWSKQNARGNKQKNLHGRGKGSDKNVYETALNAANARTNAEGEEPLVLAEHAPNLAMAFIKNVKCAPSRPLFADGLTLISRQKALLAVNLFAAELAKIPARRIGIMLPASPFASLVWMAAQFAGKEPVMLNWTVGSTNLESCCQTAEVAYVITAQKMKNLFDGQGIQLDHLPVSWLFVETMAQKFTVCGKLRAMLKTFLQRFTGRLCRDTHIPETAAILFTSGSEAKPKGVPLTHHNVMANAAAIMTVLGLRQDEKLLAMLPPFHSFGFMVGVVLPFGAGVATICHPNPTEGAKLSRLINKFEVTLLGATPSFLEGILNASIAPSTLDSLRYAFVGAEKCPQHVYDLFSRLCPKAALCEGYGITECSPVIAVNRPGNVLVGSIGYPLPGVDTMLVVEEEHTPLRRAADGENGMLLVAGENVFQGYLGNAHNPFIIFNGKSWYRTGDLVRQDASGRLFFCGRLTRFIKIGGEMISLPQIEEVLHNCLKNWLEKAGKTSGLTGDKRVGEMEVNAAEKPLVPIPDANLQKHHDTDKEDSKVNKNEVSPVLAVIADETKHGSRPDLVVVTTLPISLEAINRNIARAGLSPLYSIRRLIRREQIPVLGTGKTDYKALEHLLESETFTVTHD